MLSLRSFSLLLVCLVAKVFSRPEFQSRVPNGNRVSVNGSACPGLGHNSCAGGAVGNQNLNHFGLDFRAQGFQWTRELCLMDSDGDGLTNGEELGDPCCLFTEGSVLSARMLSVEVSHPGFPSSTTTAYAGGKPDCSTPAGRADWTPTAPPITSVFTEADQLGTTDVIEYRVNHISVPYDHETSYFDIFFNFDVAEEQDIVAIETLVDKTANLHHFIMNACTQRNIDVGNATLSSYEMTACRSTIYGWAPGGDTLVLPASVGIRIGPNSSIKGFHMQIHYTNPTLQPGIVDNSGIKIFTTTNFRREQLGLMWAGGVVYTGGVAQSDPGFVSATHCVVETMPGFSNFSVFGFNPHAHFLGRKVVTELFRKNESGVYVKVADLGREDNFSFDYQFLRKVAPITVKSGDIISAFCTYNGSTSTKPVTYGGSATTDEMCIAFLSYYPGAAYNNLVYCSGPRTYATNSTFIESYAELYPDLSNTDWKLALSTGVRDSKLKCPDAALRKAIEDDDAQYMATALFNACHTSSLSALDLLRTLQDQSYLLPDGSTIPCVDSCILFYAKMTLCSTSDPTTNIGQVWNYLKESVVSRPCFARLAQFSADTQTAMTALSTASTLTCANRPAGSVTTASSLDAMLSSSCTNMTTGGLVCSAQCAAALAGFVACASQSGATMADKEAYCYIRNKLGDGCGFFTQIADNVGLTNDMCTYFKALGLGLDPPSPSGPKSGAFSRVALPSSWGATVGVALAVLVALG